MKVLNLQQEHSRGAVYTYEGCKQSGLKKELRLKVVSLAQNQCSAHGSHSQSMLKHATASNSN